MIDVNRIPCREISNADQLIENPVVSVNMITYNHEPFIAQAIEGVVKQETEYPFELIIGEDGSIDRTREIVLAYQRKHPNLIRVLISENNVGPRRNGLRTRHRARGRYLATCEGDDYWHCREKLQLQIEHLESHPNCVLVHTAANILKHETGTIVPPQATGEYKTSSAGRNLFVSILSEEYRKTVAPIFTCTNCRRADTEEHLIENCAQEILTDRFLVGDLQRWLEYSLLGDFCHININTTTRSIHDNSITGRGDANQALRYQASVLDVQLHYAEKYAVATQKVNDTINARLHKVLKLCVKTKSAAQAKQIYSAVIGCGIRPTMSNRLLYCLSRAVSK